MCETKNRRKIPNPSRKNLNRLSRKNLKPPEISSSPSKNFSPPKKIHNPLPENFLTHPPPPHPKISQPPRKFLNTPPKSSQPNPPPQNFSTPMKISQTDRKNVEHPPPPLKYVLVHYLALIDTLYL